MSLADRLVEDMKAAMKAKDKDTLSVIRMVRAAINNAQIDRGQPLSDAEVTEILAKELKQRNDSLREFSKAGRADLTAKTEREIDILKRYLPEQLSEEQLRLLVQDTIQATGARSKADMGKVMAALMPQVKGRADGKLVNRLVQEALS
ncbi:GatB/YqeY domain-containing protein [Numidum massiliense]|uniref:GatB/YqeY domain-containing protein n=1 Tax=Numidum massiliense TaxID=1522315 RepID=UPI0006D53FDF|nr:GatB/YqeY domain-containing protein [Numidum massiliense]